MTSNDSQNKGLTLGILSALGAYCIWGMIALYWKLLTEADDVEILAHRIVWSLVFVIGLLIVKHQLGSTLRLLKNLFTAPKENHTLLLVLATVFASANWLVNIVGVTAERVVELSLGTFLTPLATRRPWQSVLWCFPKRFQNSEWPPLLLPQSALRF